MKFSAVITSLCLVFAVKSVTAERIVCYYGSWATYRPGNGQFNAEHLDPHLCTHVVYGFVGLDDVTNKVKLLDPYNDLEENWGKGAIKRFNNLRNINPQLKTMVAIGGWNEGSVRYSKMASSRETRKIFIQSATEFTLNYGFNGFDIDWEYPTQRGGLPIDRQNFVSLISEMREEFDKHGLLLSAAVGAGQYTVDEAYDVPALSRYLDFINVMTYDFHGSWESTSGHNAPLYARPDESPGNRLMNVNASIQHWIQQGAAPRKLNLGMGTYGHSFTLTNPENHGFYAPVSAPGRPGPYTQAGGTLGYNEICENQMSAQWTVVQDAHYMAPYMYSGDQWVGYDDETSIEEKCKFAKSLGLGGGMIWSIETDDFRGICGKKYPLLKVINKFLNNSPIPQPQPDPKPVPQPQPAPQPHPYPIPELDTQTSPERKIPEPQTTQEPTSNDIPQSTVEAYAIEQCSNTIIVRHPTDCTKFFECQHIGSSYIVHEKQCQSGLFFDINIKACNWKYLVIDC